MRHVIFRGIMSGVWLAVAVFSAVSGMLPMALMDVVLSAVFAKSAYAMYKKERNRDE